MAAFINHHPRPSPYAGMRATYAAIMGLVLIAMAVAVGLSSGVSREPPIRVIGQSIEPVL